MDCGFRRVVRKQWFWAIGIAFVLIPAGAGAQDRFDFDADSVFGEALSPSIPGGIARESVPVAKPLPEPGLDRPEITWRVENPFRFFTDPADTALHREVYDTLTPEQRRDPVLSAERVLSTRYSYGWAAELNGRVCWNTDGNLHRCPQGGDYVNPRSHRVRFTAQGLPDAAAIRCTWSVRGVRETRPCDQGAVLEVPYNQRRAHRVTLSVGGRVIARTNVKVEDLLIIGVGDSFGSGEGNPDRPVRFDRERTADYGTVAKRVALAGYPARVGAWRQFGDRQFVRENARWLDTACHRSLYSHQARAALQLAIENPHRAVTFLHFACSGAEITKGLFLRYRGHEWVPNPPPYSQISSIARAQCGPRDTRVQDLPEAYHMRGKVPDLKGHLVLQECDRRRSRKIDLLFVSIGGNDIGFARLVANAVLRQQTVLRKLGGWIGQVYNSRQATSRLGELAERYRAFNRALHYILHVPWNESDRVVLTAYPAMALLDDGTSVCPSGRAGMEVLPAFQLSRQRAAEGEDAAQRLHRTMRRAARKFGWSFAEGHRDKFIGHGICAGYTDAALTSVDDLRFPRRVNGRWIPYNPADYRPYASRQRWFRTPNDAYLTGHFHVTGSLLQKVLRNQNLTWTQVLLAATYSGAFHPTAEGHAAIADSVVRVSRRVLEKYSGRNRRK